MAAYLICFHEPLGHARHYLGWTERPSTVARRLKRHRQGNGARLMAAVERAGIGWELVRVWPDADRNEERRLKNMGGHARLCPRCRAKARGEDV